LQYRHKNKFILPLIGALLGFSFFSVVFGWKILNPTFIEWSLHLDAAQHYLGWHHFRYEPWHFPLGEITTYNAPYGTSIVYTDSIPLFAITLKLLSPLLPEHFQYHGLWLLLVYILQGVFGVLLLKRITGKTAASILGSTFLLMSPVMIQRAEIHEALSCHFVILAAIYLYLDNNNLKTNIKWLILIILTALIHFYLLVMVLALWAGYILKIILTDFKTSVKPLTIYFSITAITLIFTMWITGYFIFSPQYSGSVGFGFYSMNLLAPFNPAPIHSFNILKQVNLASQWQYEGFNYWGAGIIIIIILAIYELSRNKIKFSKSRDLPLLIICSILTLIAISNKITFAEHIILEYKLPDFLSLFAGMLRSSGRMFWPVTYIVTVIALAVVAKSSNTYRMFCIIMFALIIQFVDFYPFYQTVNFEKITWKTPLKSELWDKLANKYNNISLVPAVLTTTNYVPFSLLSVKHKNKLNIGYTARSNHIARRNYETELFQNYVNGKLDKQTLYIIQGNSLYKPLPQFNAATFMIDGYAVIAPDYYGDTKNFTPWPYSLVQASNKITISNILDKYSSNVSILISIKNTDSSAFPRPFLSKMKALGSQIHTISNDSGYAAVISNGKLLGEKIALNNNAGLDQLISGYHVVLNSSPTDAGNRSEISINSMPFSNLVLNTNIIIINNVNGEICRFIPSKADLKANTINKLFWW